MDSARMLLLLCSVLTLVHGRRSTDCPRVDMSNHTAGYPDDTTIDKVTLLGAHNSGAYINAGVIRSIPDPLSSCWARNQEFPWSKQLQLGVRYFDMDLAYEEDGSLTFYHGEGKPDDLRDFFFKPVADGLKDLRCFIAKNPSEIVFLHLNREFVVYPYPPTRSRSEKAAKAMFDLLDQTVGEHVFPLQKYFEDNRRFPTLGEARRQKKTIFVMMSDKYARYKSSFNEKQRSWAIRERQHHSIGWMRLPIKSSWFSLWVGDYKAKVASYCRTTKSFFDLQVLPKKKFHKTIAGQCNDHLAELFAEKRVVQNSFEVCLRERCKNNLAVNFVSVDYVDLLRPQTLKLIYSKRC